MMTVTPRPERPLIEPHELADVLGSRPSASSPPGGWDDVVLQRFGNLPPVIDVPPMRNEVLVCHLGGPFLAEVGVGTSRYERRWIGPGQLGVNPAGGPVRRAIRGRPDVVLVHLPPTMLRTVADEAFDVDPSRVDLLPVLATPDETADRLIGLLLREAVCPTSGTPLMVRSVTHALMVHVLRLHSSLAPSRPDRPGAMSPGRMRRVVDHMRTHLDRPPSLTDLASVAGLSPSRFARAFRDAMGQPPHRFMVRLRIERACRLLEETDLNITAVGIRCGFDQPSHFATMFRGVMGMTPGTWRRGRRG